MNVMARSLLIFAIALAVLATGGRAGNGQATGQHRLEREGLVLELAPLRPDQVRAFFLARGFEPSAVERIVREGCVFRSSIGSAFTQPDDPVVLVSLPNWRVVTPGGQSQPPMTREDWDEIWSEGAVRDSALTAFYWALFPTEQSFGPTDYNWGMLTFGLPPGTRFELQLRWRIWAKEHDARLEDLRCG